MPENETTPEEAAAIRLNWITPQMAVETAETVGKAAATVAMLADLDHEDYHRMAKSIDTIRIGPNCLSRALWCHSVMNALKKLTTLLENTVKKIESAKKAPDTDRTVLSL